MSNQLIEVQKYEIYLGFKRKWSQTRIANEIGVSKSTVKTVIKLHFPYHDSIKTITTDNGCEFATHPEITKKLTPKRKDNIIVYFADSYCSWQKEAIENTNKLIRPKKANFEDFSNLKILGQILSIQKKLNRRPKEKLDFNSPKSRFFANLN